MYDSFVVLSLENVISIVSLEYYYYKKLNAKPLTLGLITFHITTTDSVSDDKCLKNFLCAK